MLVTAFYLISYDVWMQMLLILTKSVNRCFEKNPKFDMTPLLGGTDIVFSSLIHSFSWFVSLLPLACLTWEMFFFCWWKTIQYTVMIVPHGLIHKWTISMCALQILFYRWWTIPVVTVIDHPMYREGVTFACWILLSFLTWSVLNWLFSLQNIFMKSVKFE